VFLVDNFGKFAHKIAKGNDLVVGTVFYLMPVNFVKSLTLRTRNKDQKMCLLLGYMWT